MKQYKESNYMNSETASISGECRKNIKIKDKHTINDKLILLLTLILLFLIGITIWLFYYFIIWEGSFEVSQEVSQIELGSSSDLLSTLKYDDANIINIQVKETDFNAEKIGTYTVSYDITNIRNNEREISFSYEVVDTTAPEISLKENLIYLKKDSEFSIDEFVDVDELNTYELIYDGNLDLTVEGEYNIHIMAIDAAGNESNTCDLNICVEDRDNCVIRNVKFGDTREIVERYEDAILIKESTTYLQYSVRYGNYYDASVAYVFNEDNELYSIVYLINVDHEDYGNYISNFNNISDSLTTKYGEPSEKTVVKGAYYNYCADQADALQKGQVSFFSVWDLNDRTIYEYLSNDGDIYFSVVYEAKEINKQENLDNY